MSTRESLVGALAGGGGGGVGGVRGRWAQIKREFLDCTLANQRRPSPAAEPRCHVIHAVHVTQAPPSAVPAPAPPPLPLTATSYRVPTIGTQGSFLTASDARLTISRTPIPLTGLPADGLRPAPELTRSLSGSFYFRAPSLPSGSSRIRNHRS